MIVNSIANYSVHNTSLNSNNNTVKAASQNMQTSSSVQVPFNGIFPDIFFKKFNTPEEKAMYKELNAVLSGKDKANLDILYKTGKLSNNDSNDKTSTLHNLYKIYTEPRIVGLDNKKVLSETLARIADPFTITQRFGKIPDKVATQVLEEYKADEALSKQKFAPKNKNDMDIKNSASCVAASIEFSLADKKPAEFARMVAGLSGQEASVVQNVKLENLNKNVLDAFALLKMFNVNPEKSDWQSATIRIKPDRDAIVRARVQNTYCDGKNRSSVDVLMQSAFMQLGSQSTYNSLTDKRYGSLNTNDTGLTEFEKTFVESVVNNDGEKTSMVYQDVDDKAVLKGYTHPPEVVKQHILTTLANNQNVIVGITETDGNKRIIGGHEITIVASKEKNGELYFVCNDTDDNYSGPIEVKAEILIPKIHHAGIPVSVVEVKDTSTDRGQDLLKQYSQKSNAAVPA